MARRSRNMSGQVVRLYENKTSRSQSSLLNHTDTENALLRPPACWKRHTEKETKKDVIHRQLCLSNLLPTSASCVTTDKFENDRINTMYHKEKDYYDLPPSWTTSSTLVYQPTSEISNISDFSFMDSNLIISSSSSSSSSSSLSSVEDVPTSRSRSTSRAPSTPRTPIIIVTGPNREARLSKMRSVDEDMQIIYRPRLRKKSATAPPGGMSASGYAPQPPQLPRRAISARWEGSDTIQGRITQQGAYVTNHLAIRKHLEDEHSRQQWLSQPGRSPPQLPCEGEQRIGSKSVTNPRLSSSFSHKARVRKTLDDKNLGRLSIVDFETRGLLSSRSMMNTPRELYAIPEKRSTDREPSHSFNEGPSSPRSIEARRSILSSLSLLSPDSRQSRRVRTKRHKDKKAHQDGWQRVYIPGAIRPEKHPATLRKGSVATLDPFDEAVETRSKRYSDTIILTSLTMFFADLSIVEEATEQCLDRFWCGTKPTLRHVASHKNPSITSIQEVPVPESPGQPLDAWAPGSSRFSFSSASSSSSMPPPGALGRQRDRLRRLLPAFGGSVK